MFGFNVEFMNAFWRTLAAIGVLLAVVWVLGFCHPVPANAAVPMVGPTKIEEAQGAVCPDGVLSVDELLQQVLDEPEKLVRVDLYNSPEEYAAGVVVFEAFGVPLDPEISQNSVDFYAVHNANGMVFLAATDGTCVRGFMVIPPEAYEAWVEMHREILGRAGDGGRDAMR